MKFLCIEAKAETLSDLKARLESAETASQQGVHQLTELSSANHQLEQQVAQLQHQLNDAHMETGRLSAQVDQLGDRVQILTASEASLKTALEAESRQLEEAKKIIESASKSLFSRLKFIISGR